MDLTKRRAFAIRIAKAAGLATLKHFRQSGLAVEVKSDASPVTIADKEAELLIRSAIEQELPGDGVLGEEFGETPGTNEFRWILDPIDGTKSFIHGVPLYGTLIGLQHAGESVLGVIAIPALDELVYAVRGEGAWRVSKDGPATPAKVGGCTALSDAVICTSDTDGYAKIDRLDVLQKLAASGRYMRTWGDAFGYYMVATGQIDVMIDPRMHIWDMAALKPVIEEAGGQFCNWNGERSITGTNAIATNSALMPQLLEMVRA